MKPDVKLIGQRLKALREYSGLSREEFGVLFDAKERTVCDWEHGCYIPMLLKLLNISNYYGISLDYLISGEPSGKSVLEKKLDEATPIESSELPGSHYAGQFIVQFNSLPLRHKERLIGYLDALCKENG